jgi:carboxyl-terminal processing protease
MKLSLSVIASLWLSFVVHAEAQETGWKVPHGFTVSASATSALQSPAGAAVDLLSAHDVTTPGFAHTSIDAAHLREKRVTLSGDFDVTAELANGGAAIYLQPRDPNGKLSFATSESGGLIRTHQRRDVTLTIPAATTRLLIGVALVGGGEVKIDHLRLSIADAPQATASEVVDVAIKVVLGNALYADRIDWVTLEPHMRNAAKGMQDSSQAYPLIVNMLAALRDHHSFFLPVNEQTDLLQHGRANGELSVRVLPGGVGYINVPGFMGVNHADSGAFANALASGIVNIAPNVSHGWVVDLRQDTGGNMYPMLSGLHALLGAGKLGTFRLRSGQETPWASSPPASFHATALALVHTPVAVLIGPHTASSGEAVAISFKGRPSTRFFGQPSNGRTTANRIFPLPDGSGLVLTCSMDLDRDGHSYEEQVKPDVEIPLSTQGEDATLAAATAWLGNQSSAEFSH